MSSPEVGYFPAPPYTRITRLLAGMLDVCIKAVVLDADADADVSATSAEK